MSPRHPTSHARQTHGGQFTAKFHAGVTRVCLAPLVAMATFFLPIAAIAPMAAADASRTLNRPAGERPDPSTDEGGIWAIMDKEEDALKASALRNQDPALNAYVREIMCRVAAEYCNDIRVYVIDQPVWNAFMAPNGMMAIYSGLILRADNEAQLACVIGHEAGHFAQNHSIENWRATKNRSTMALVFSLGLAAAGVPASDLVGLVALGSLARFSRTQETEADDIGFTRVRAAGYDPRACANVWEDLIAELQSSDFRKMRRRASDDGDLFSSHPGAPLRVAAMRAKAAELAPGGDLGAERHARAIQPHLADWIASDLRRKDFGSSIHFLERRLAQGRDLGLYSYFTGEAHRLRGKPGDQEKALKFYEAAAGHIDAPPQTWRELGEAYRRKGETAKARAAFSTYLDKAPQAQDRPLIDMEMKALESEAQ